MCSGPSIQVFPHPLLCDLDSGFTTCDPATAWGLPQFRVFLNGVQALPAAPGGLALPCHLLRTQWLYWKPEWGVQPLAPPTPAPRWPPVASPEGQALDPCVAGGAPAGPDSARPAGGSLGELPGGSAVARERQANFPRRPRVSAAFTRTSGAGSLSSSWSAGGREWGDSGLLPRVAPAASRGRPEPRTAASTPLHPAPAWARLSPGRTPLPLPPPPPPAGATRPPSSKTGLCRERLRANGKIVFPFLVFFKLFWNS